MYAYVKVVQSDNKSQLYNQKSVQKHPGNYLGLVGL